MRESDDRRRRCRKGKISSSARHSSSGTVSAQKIMNELVADGVLNRNAPFEHDVQWTFWELWHHEGRRARHGASMMGPDYTHWHGMYEVAKHWYLLF